jgi:hypothetical protein
VALECPAQRNKVSKWFEKDFARKYVPPAPKTNVLPLSKVYLQEWQEKYFPLPAEPKVEFPIDMDLVDEDEMDEEPLPERVEHFTPTPGRSHFMKEFDVGMEVDSGLYSPQEISAAEALLELSFLPELGREFYWSARGPGVLPVGVN